MDTKGMKRQTISSKCGRMFIGERFHTFMQLREQQSRKYSALYSPQRQESDHFLVMHLKREFIADVRISLAIMSNLCNS